MPELLLANNNAPTPAIPEHFKGEVDKGAGSGWGREGKYRPPPTQPPSHPPPAAAVPAALLSAAALGSPPLRPPRPAPVLCFLFLSPPFPLPLSLSPPPPPPGYCCWPPGAGRRARPLPGGAGAPRGPAAASPARLWRRRLAARLRRLPPAAHRGPAPAAPRAAALRKGRDGGRQGRREAGQEPG